VVEASQALPLQPDFFAETEPHPAVSKLKELDVDDLTPKQALDYLYQLQALARQE